MWSLFELSINLLQALMMLLFMKSRLHIHNPKPHADALCVLGIAVFLSLYAFVRMPVSDIAVFVIPLVYALVIADDKWYVSLFWTLVLCLVFAVSTSLILHLFMSLPMISYDMLMANTLIRIITVLATNTVLFLFLFAIGKMKTELTAPAWSALLLLVAMNAALFIVEEAIFSLQMELSPDYSEMGTIPFWGIYIGLLLCIALSILLFHRMSQSADRENRYKLEASAMALSRRHVQELERMYADLQEYRHDFKQHFQTLEEMISLGGNEKASSYLADYKKRLSGNEIFITGCMAVDALLTAKYLTMQKHDLAFVYTGYPLNELPVGEADFCSIVGNLLDNAIEGTLRIRESAAIQPIHLTFSRSWDMFYIFCANSCDPQTIRKGKNGWQSSKESEGLPGAHAIGIRNILRIAEAAEGRGSFAVQSNTFHAKVVLPYPHASGRNEKCS